LNDCTYWILLRLQKLSVAFVSRLVKTDWWNGKQADPPWLRRRDLYLFGHSSGGDWDIACLTCGIVIIARHEKRRFPEKVDYITRPGVVVTTQGVLRFHSDTPEKIFLR